MDEFDPRTIAERCLMNGGESYALRGLADEMGMSKSGVLRFAFLKLLRERVARRELAEAEILGASRPDGRPEHGQ